MKQSSNTNKNMAYHRELLKKISLIYHENNDLMQNAVSQIQTTNLNIISFMKEYPMQKQGKNFKTIQQRILRITNKGVYQIDKKGNEKDLPYPSSITKQQINNTHHHQWGISTHKFRLILQFQQRNSIFVYGKTKQQIGQLFIYLKGCKTNISSLKKSFSKIYINKMIQYFILNLKHNKNKTQFSNQQNKFHLTHKIKNLFHTPKLIKELIVQWHKKAVMTSQINNNKNQIFTKNLVTDLSFDLHELRSFSQYGITKGEMKFWVGQMTIQKTVKFSQTLTNNFLCKDAHQINAFKNISIFNLNNSPVKIKTEDLNLQIWTILQFQVQSVNQHNQVQSWKSQRFFIIDLLKSVNKCPKTTVTLWNGKRFMQVLLTVTSAKSQAIRLELPPQHQSFPSSYTYKITPNHYPLLRQIIPSRILQKYMKNLTPETVQLQYTIAYQEFIQTQSIQTICFSSFFRLYDILNIDNIIQKFYLTPPYSEYINITHKATFIYQYLIKKSDKFFYFDAEKFVWKHHCTNFRRFLSAIKAFDQFPRINYTQPFFALCIKCLEISQNQSLIKWKSNLFADNIIGRQSLAFFLVLGTIKSSSQMLLYHPIKTVLANNSLLFHFVMKKYSRSLYNKFLQIQLNIEAFFGDQSVSIFSSLFSTYNFFNGCTHGGSHEVYLFALINFINERKDHSNQSEQQHGNKANQTRSKKILRGNHYFSLISFFIALIHIFDAFVTNQTANDVPQQNTDQIVQNSTAYVSAHSFLEYFKIFVRTQLQTYMLQLTSLYKIFYSFCEKQFNDKEQTSDYLTLQESLQKFHISCYPSTASSSVPQLGKQNQVSELHASGVSNLSLGQLMQQLYPEFMCYKHKNESAIRKICIMIDHISLGEQAQSQMENSSVNYRPPSLIIQLVQNGRKIYLHELVMKDKPDLGMPLNYENLKHTMEIKLDWLSPLELIFTCNRGDQSSSFSCKLDPKELPSNYYLQLVQPLTSICNLQEKKGLVHTESKIGELGAARHVALQVYIKDNCEVDYFQNNVPNNYINLLLLQDRIHGQGKSQGANVTKDTMRKDAQLQAYKNDIIFCNHYFRSFRLPEANFNLLYAKLGWYGNHYLVPSSRVISIENIYTGQSLVTENKNNSKTMQNIIETNIPQIQITPLSLPHRQRLNQILFYTRCIYGRGLIPSIAYPISGSSSHSQLLMQSLRGGILTRECKQLKHQINQFQFNSCGNLVGYLFDNFDVLNSLNKSQSRSSANFIDFYWRATNELPLIHYLTFRTLQFYLLEETKMTLRIPNLKSVDSRNYSSNPSQHNDSHHHLSQSPQAQANIQLNYSSLHKEHQSLSNQEHSEIMYDIIFTNHSLTLGYQSETNSNQQTHPYLFITDPAHFQPQLYQTEETAGTDRLFDPKLLYNNLLQGINLPNSFYFTYPTGLEGRSSIDGMDDIQGMGGSGGTATRELLLDQFLWLLKMNILKYYVIGNKRIQDSGSNKKQKKKAKKVNATPDCLIKFAQSSFVNMNMADFFRVLCETKYGVDLIAVPITPIAMNTSSQKSESIFLPPVILNQAFRHYTSFANSNGNWVEVCILARVNTPSYTLYYTEQKFNRKLTLYKNNLIILGIQSKRMLDKLPLFKFTDHELIANKDCLRKDLYCIF